MRKISILLMILFFSFHSNQFFAQNKKHSKDLIIVELSINNEEAQSFQVPINRKVNENDGILINSVSECFGSYEEGIPCNTYYDINMRAYRLGQNNVNVGIKAESFNTCKIRKVFKVYRNKQTKLRLNCGVSLVAYYGFKSE